MFASGPEQLSLPMFAEAAAGVGDLRPIVYGLLLLLASVACAQLLSSAAKQAKVMLDLLMGALRTFFLALVVALLVVAVVLLAFADLLAQR
jgi:hypothetical protein